jgi:maltoporin
VSLALLALLAAVDPVPAAPPDGFDYGSYGRIGVASDLDGGPGVGTNVVTHGSRLEEPPYLELDLYYNRRLGAPVQRWRVVTSLAFSGELLHAAGENAQTRVDVRNLYLQTDGVLHPWLSLWAGSRMLRGDDVYLLDYWPLDNLNTIGAGAIWHPPRWELSLHVGANRLDDAYQFQEVAQLSPAGGPPDLVVNLNRQRIITSAKASWQFRPGMKAALYAEGHAIGQGVLTLPDRTQERLPDDQGFAIGGQWGAFGPRGFVNLFLRFATGLAAYGDLTVPYAVAADKRAADARQLVAAFSTGCDGRRAGVVAGGYISWFSPAQTGYSEARAVEGIVAIRPQLFVTQYFGAAGELSYQRRDADTLDQTLRPESADVFKLTAMPAVVTLAPGALGRPQLRLVYTLSLLSQGARAQLARTDSRLNDDTIHYLGVQAEWWFNSAYR